jgi:hypothetical protein
MCAGLEGEGPAEEALLIELRPVITARGVLLDEIDGRGVDGTGESVRGEGEAEGEASRGVGGEVADEPELHGHFLVGNYHLSILLASDYKNNQLPIVQHPHPPQPKVSSRWEMSLPWEGSGNLGIYSKF